MAVFIGELLAWLDLSQAPLPAEALHHSSLKVRSLFLGLLACSWVPCK